MLNSFYAIRRRHTRWPRDWSSDVCSSDLIAYHERLLQIAAADVRAPSPTDLQPRVSEALSDLADAALAAGAAIARAAVPGQERVRWAVIAMGKTGARELNFISDVDVMHVVAPAEEPGRDRKSTRLNSSHVAS